MSKQNWSVNLETEEYADDRDLVIADSIQAILETGPGGFVNLAIAPQHGNPDDYLLRALADRFRDAVAVRFVDQCGCGGYVYRVSRLQ
ncbi:CGCGG family rSAM-modified RiPP protein [Sulfoacidibacillus ferrooxidans]|uniref:CGCGG family rSAM-modified RiPP protein n=1 Tax=Sulfoacidibacillus ferrooxidans TaxID=2005001 RepID=A0A9X1VA54_9BACL|nr:CGCGG family rSAM-modified RiPP protein [Sulfoacidibacillus ferrooxidans]MCI0184486.1 hypothetical protein [Sulfoacidibacillus ferrooxidans]